MIADRGHDLDTLVAAGLFNGELSYRLAGTEIPIPPQAGRPDDAAWLMGEVVRETGSPPDDPALARAAICDAPRTHAAVISSSGASTGDEEHVLDAPCVPWRRNSTC
ncbi:hypothetical protein ACVDG3_11090 [Meridianimarinicoccus sp. RP-17]|uniref:hypothetical protein n=1 Tax=Meridianimarinicoccus zhengii TaxID=2056810 RepID=UPI000DAEF84E|nr:hypothetical protein [Phycocomes zhengii]